MRPRGGNKQNPNNKDHFYAGARFETHPSHVGLPVPPSHWTAPLQRSQSQPSSPVPTTMPQKGVSVDLATLFGHSSPNPTSNNVRSASFPGVRLMDAIMQKEDERKKKEQLNVNQQLTLTEPPRKSIEEANKFFRSLQLHNAQPYIEDETDELKKALGLSKAHHFTSSTPVTPSVKSPQPQQQPQPRVTTCNRNPPRSELSPSKYQDISVQLKTLLKVAA